MGLLRFPKYRHFANQFGTEKLYNDRCLETFQTFVKVVPSSNFQTIEELTIMILCKKYFVLKYMTQTILTHFKQFGTKLRASELNPEIFLLVPDERSFLEVVPSARKIFTVCPADLKFRNFSLDLNLNGHSVGLFFIFTSVHLDTFLRLFSKIAL